MKAILNVYIYGNLVSTEHNSIIEAVRSSYWHLGDGSAAFYSICDTKGNIVIDEEGISSEWNMISELYEDD